MEDFRPRLRIERARSMRDVPPEVSLEGGFDLIDFVVELKEAADRALD